MKPSSMVLAAVEAASQSTTSPVRAVATERPQSFSYYAFCAYVPCDGLDVHRLPLGGEVGLVAPVAGSWLMTFGVRKFSGHVAASYRIHRPTATAAPFAMMTVS